MIFASVLLVVAAMSLAHASSPIRPDSSSPTAMPIIDTFPPSTSYPTLSQSNATTFNFQVILSGLTASLSSVDATAFSNAVMSFLVLTMNQFVYLGSESFTAMKQKHLESTNVEVDFLVIVPLNLNITEAGYIAQLNSTSFVNAVVNAAQALGSVTFDNATIYNIIAGQGSPTSSPSYSFAPSTSSGIHFC
jgi:hypothetical protein